MFPCPLSRGTGRGDCCLRHPEDLKGVDVVHLHTVADWFDVPRWLETLPRRIGVVIGVHGMWHLQEGASSIVDAIVSATVARPARF